MKELNRITMTRHQYHLCLLILITMMSNMVRASPTIPTGGEFCLEAHRAQQCLSDFKGKVVLLYFGYTACPDICPTSLMTIREAYRLLPEPIRQHTQVIMISVDPERDTPTSLHAYMSYFDASFMGLSGDMINIRKIAEQYGAKFERVPITSAMHYAVDHSAAVYLIDPVGTLLGQFKHGTTAQDMAEGVLYAHQSLQSKP